LIAGAQMVPVRSREIVKGQQLIAISGKAVDRFRILLPVGGSEPIERLLGARAAVR